MRSRSSWVHDVVAMDQHVTIHAGRLYADTRGRGVLLFRSLDLSEERRPVPLSPAWTVRDVAAHVCGINADVVSGNLAGLGTDDWTAAQVAAWVTRPSCSPAHGRPTARFEPAMSPCSRLRGSITSRYGDEVRLDPGTVPQR